ncbi:hypothetical protein UFOVP669_5 [uncultured Caudovirales phage]|uniref:Uncharacterized protein n=1 Tax=uncultured Caudovirales phage TaxID=2100421 RepID=A0A6J5SGZ6_9CAUD|nr:hypothetical protein UFOVP400_53 [uncultured Caudovirales phage]CAB4155392.1 hypothetical protein UFOVP669_5 [uncultured Caudovirales phage]CAB4213383.1 hypothetical protein UFOVP1449_10 [uncultured Caudovirales phage]
MLDERLVRLELLKVLLPAASRAGLTDPSAIVQSAGTLEKYVLGLSQHGEKTPDSPTSQQFSKAPKGKA